MNEDEQYVADLIKTWVWSGFYDEDEIHENIDDILDGDVDEDMLHCLVKNEILLKEKEKNTWAKVTDCDKLDDVFESLNNNGIVALQNTGITMSDGHDDIGEALEERGKDGIIGYCFYHGQDLERAVAGQGILLAFGDLKDTPEGKTKVAKLICTTIAENNLTCKWNGNPESRIAISSFNWQRRTVR